MMEVVLKFTSKIIANQNKGITNEIITCCQILKNKKSFLRIQWKLIFPIVIRCSRLRHWIGYFIYFKFTSVFL